MQVFPAMLAAALANAPLANYHVADAPSAIERGWRQVASDRDRDCAISVTGDGRFFRITTSGFEPDEIGYFELANEDARPIRYNFRSDGNGRFSKIYLPFLHHRDGGTVAVSAEGEACSVSTAFDWTRSGVRVH